MNDPHLVYYERSIHRNGTVLQREETLREKKFNCAKIIVGSRQDRTRNMYETLPSERGLDIILQLPKIVQMIKNCFTKRYGPHGLLTKGLLLIEDGGS